MNRGPLGTNGSNELYLAPDAIESIAANPNYGKGYGKAEYAAQTVIRMKVTGAIHYVDESTNYIAEQVKAYTCIKA